MRRVPDAEDVEFEAPNAPKIETPKLSRGWGFGEWVYYKNDFAALPACQNAPHCDICSQFNVLSADVFRQKKLICVFCMYVSDSIGEKMRLTPSSSVANWKTFCRPWFDCFEV